MVTALLSFAGSGCVSPLENAILELDVTLPPSTRPAETTHAVFEVQTGASDFIELWPSEAHAGSVPVPRMPSAARISIAADREHAFLSIKVRFCEDTRCSAAGSAFAPETRIRIAEPFYLGEYSEVTLAIDHIPTPIETIDMGRCEVRACASEPRGNYCDETGVHLCEAAAAD
jgi:hypothetical protein